ncbi:hypothetical protein [Nocardia sp. NBC_01327]|uniref:hypothetical protein n=1 Tax=Nocardia sp. NBC_01327 TaxID=2903593 RepID=UPI002E14506C|nr:hypothetical protein OG326_12615 [Nocardia sp. NBC_01327]
MTSPSRRALRAGFTALTLASVLAAGAGTATADLPATSSATGSNTPQGGTTSPLPPVITSSAETGSSIGNSIFGLYCNFVVALTGNDGCETASGGPA